MSSLLLLAAPAFALDPLLNAGFESGDLTSWNAWGDETIVVTAPIYEGTYATQLTLDPASEGFQQTGLYQDVAGVSGGEHLQLTVFASASTTDPVTLDGQLLLKWEATGGELGDGDEVVQLNADGTWASSTVDFTTPDGTTSVRYVLLFEANDAGADGTVFVDGLAIDPVEVDSPSDSGTDDSGCGCDQSGLPTTLKQLGLVMFVALLRRQVRRHSTIAPAGTPAAVNAARASGHASSPS